MKKLLLVLMVMGTLASCGKDNKVDSGVAGFNGTVTNPLVTGSGTGTALVSMINNPSSFGQGQLSLGGGSNGTCKTVAYIINYCYSSTSSGSGTVTTWNNVVAQYPGLTYVYSNYTNVKHADVNVANKQAELIGILNAATNVQYNNAGSYYIYTANGTYVIDTRYPIQAQPSGVQTNTANYYLYQAI